MFAKKQKIWVSLISFAILTSMLAGCSAGAGGPLARGGGPGEIGETCAVQTMVVADTIGTSGTVEAFQDAELAWKTSGVIEDVKVKPGDTVKEGDVLAVLIDTSVPSSILSAYTDLISARQMLADLYEPPTELEIAQAEEAVVSAQDDLETKQDRANYLGTPARQSDIDQARATVLLAKIQMDRAFDDYKPFEKKQDDNPIKAALYNKYTQAQQKYDDAVRRLNNLQGVTVDPTELSLADAEFKLAQARLADAQETLADLGGDPDPDDVAAAQARITAAEATLSAMQITAPFDGEILAVEAKPGDVVLTNQTAMTLANRGQMHVDALVDETEIGSIQVGDPVNVSLETDPGKSFTGHVSFINPMGEDVQGNIKYPVQVDLDPVDNPLMLGATADLTIQVGQPGDSLVVCVRAIQTDALGEFVMVAMPDGNVRRIDVSTGQLLGDQVVILEGDLQPGDQAALAQVSSMFEQAAEENGGGGFFGRP